MPAVEVAVTARPVVGADAVVPGAPVPVGVAVVGAPPRERQWVSLLAVVAVLALWELAGRAQVFGPQALPAPSQILAQLWRDRRIYPGNVTTTLREAWPGFLWGNLAAIVLGVAFAHRAILERLMSGVIISLMCMPLIAIGPVLAIVLHGDAPKSWLAGLSCFFLTLVATVLGLRSADRAAMDVVRSSGGGWWQLLWRVRFRSALPLIAVALRLAVPSALLGAILGEFLGGKNGLGVTMMGSMAQLEVARTWGLALVATALGAIGFYGIGMIARAAGIAIVSPPSGVAPASYRGRRRSLPIRGLTVAATLGASVAVTLGLWMLFVHRLNHFFAKSPTDVWRFVISGTGAGANRHQILSALGQTLPTTLLGYLAGLAAAFAGAVVFVLWRHAERAIMPFALTIQSIPLAALAPLLVLLFGRGLAATVMVSVLVTFFPSLVAITEGMRSAPDQVTDVLRSFDASRWTILRRVQLPSAVPAFFAAARVSAPRALLGVLIAEYLATGKGIGWMLNLAKTRSEFTLVWAGAVVITLVSVAAYVAIGWMERAMLSRFAPEVMA